MNQDLTLSPRTLLPKLSSKYKANDLPWDMKIAYPHPTLDDEVITADAGMPHAVKKQVNAVELSGKKKTKRDLHLNGLPVQFGMMYGTYKQRQDSTPKGVITIYPNLCDDVFENKTQIKDVFCSCRTRFDSCLEICEKKTNGQICGYHER